MSSILSEFGVLLGIPGDSTASTPMSQNNTFSQQTISVANPFYQFSANEYITKLVERAIDARLFKLEERVLHAVHTENERIHNMLLLNAAKSDQIRQLLNDRPCDVQTLTNIRNTLGSRNGFSSCIDRDNMSIVDSCLSAGNSMLTNGSSINKKDLLHERMTMIEKRINRIFEHTEVLNKNLGQNIVDLNNNVEQRVKEIINKLDIVSDGIRGVDQKLKNGANDSHQIMVKQIKGPVIPRYF